MGEGAARRPVVWKAPSPTTGPQEEWGSQTPEWHRGKNPATSRCRCRPLPAEKMPEGVAAEGPPRPHAWGRLEAESRAPPSSPRARARASAVGGARRCHGGGVRVKARARRKPREGGGEAGNRERPRELGTARARARSGLGRSPRVLA